MQIVQKPVVTMVMPFPLEAKADMVLSLSVGIELLLSKAWRDVFTNGVFQIRFFLIAL